MSSHSEVTKRLGLLLLLRDFSFAFSSRDKCWEDDFSEVDDEFSDTPSEDSGVFFFHGHMNSFGNSIGWPLTMTMSGYGDFFFFLEFLSLELGPSSAPSGSSLLDFVLSSDAAPWCSALLDGLALSLVTPGDLFISTDFGSSFSGPVRVVPSPDLLDFVLCSGLALLEFVLSADFVPCCRPLLDFVFCPGHALLTLLPWSGLSFSFWGLLELLELELGLSSGFAPSWRGLLELVLCPGPAFRTLFVSSASPDVLLSVDGPEGIKCQEDSNVPWCCLPPPPVSLSAKDLFSGSLSSPTGRSLS